MRVRDILHLIEPLHIYGDAEFTIAKSLDNAVEGSIVFIDKNKKGKREIIRDTKASVIICDETVELPKLEGKCYIITGEPRKDFLRIVRWLIPDEVGISPHAIIYKGYVELGMNVTIGAGSTIGGVGFGHEWLDGKLVNWPHLGKVIIGDDVEIQGSCQINRGILLDTVIGRRTKIGNWVNIGHNVVIGEDTIIAPKVSISGSTKIGDRCFIAIGATIRDGIVIGDRVLVGMGSVVTEGIEPGVTAYGNPARVVRAKVEGSNVFQ